MKSLLIDTSSFFVTIAIFEDSKIIDIFQDSIKDDMAAKIIPIIDNILTKNEILLEDIKTIYCVNGPGSFTGVRIGVSIAKTISWAKNIKLIALSSLELLASMDTDTKYNIGMIDARRGNVFAGVYDHELNNIFSDQLISYTDVVSIYDEGSIISVNSLDNSIFPKYNLEKLIAKHQSDEPVNPHSLKPNYLKLPEAEEKKNETNNQN